MTVSSSKRSTGKRHPAPGSVGLESNAVAKTSAGLAPKKTAPLHSKGDFAFVETKPVTGGSGADEPQLDPRVQLAAQRDALKAVIPVSAKQIMGQPLEVVDAADLGGTSHKFLAAGGGTQFLGKPVNARSTAFEQDSFALGLRSFAGEVVVPLVRTWVLPAEGAPIDAMVKPMITGAQPLSAEPTHWNRSQRAVILADLAWAELTGNYDMKPQQYIVVRAPGAAEPSAINIDWDHALTDYKRPGALTRYKVFSPGGSPGSPTAQNLLFHEYVKGRVDLDFAPLFDAVDRISALPETELRAQLRPFLEKAFAGGKAYGRFASGEELIEAVLTRQRRLRAAIGALFDDLQAERARRAMGGAHLTPTDMLNGVRDVGMIARNRISQSRVYRVLARSYRALGGSPG